MSGRPGESGAPVGPRAGDLLVAAYLAATGILAVVSGTRIGFFLAGLHLVGLAALHFVARLPVPRNPAGAFLRLGWPVAITPLFYMELATLNQQVFPGYFDTAVQGWEEALFGAQLSVISSGWLDALWFSELLHLGYVSYYLIVPLGLLAGWKFGGRAGLERVAFTTALAFYLCYLCFAVFPVAGPRYEFARIAGPQTEGLFFTIVHGILETGSAKGTAFPSSHVAATVSAWIAAGLYDRRAFWILAPFAVSLTLGTVYGRFHYGIDALAGLFFAAVAVPWAPRLMRRLAPVAPAGNAVTDAAIEDPTNDHGSDRYA